MHSEPGEDLDQEREERPHRLRAFATWATRPLARMWSSEEPLDAYGLVQMSSSAVDALVALASLGAQALAGGFFDEQGGTRA